MASEKRSLVRFLVIYLLSTLLLFSLASWIYYTSSKDHLIDTQHESLKYEAEGLKSTLMHLHQSNDDRLYYPYNEKIRTALYDVDKNYIFGTFDTVPQYTDKEKNMLYHRTKIEPYYLGAAYVVLARKIDRASIEALQKSVILFMLIAGVFFLILGYFLGRLFVAPMRESLEKMNHFIQDTTHELNTPISTILTNIELIETFGKHTENRGELKRIEIASKTLSRIYDDLTYLNLNHQYHRDVSKVNLSELISERILYFTAMAETKKLQVITHISSNLILDIDKNDALRLVDNLLSNAIKYNKQYGRLEVILNDNGLRVLDTGVGIKKEKLHSILQRFKRANKSEGGFGIGLHIVSKVCESYSFELEIDSTENKGTEVKILWKK
ncbi:MAG: HAMP domain-containing histidine kinase [Sulfurovum sp.]|nr:HAMP domain-containing histidine kinase [Sulfurovum sp.]